MHPKITARFAIGLVENNNNELLLLKRSPQAPLGPGLWGFPAGHIERDESPAHCIKRELKEEIGADHMLAQITDIGPVRDTHYGGIYEIYLFHFTWQTGSIRLNHEHTDYAWVGREDFKSYKVMDGVDEDILYLDIWPRDYLHGDKLPHKVPAQGRAEK